MPEYSAGDLGGIELLCDLSKSVLSHTAKNCRWRSYSANEQIIDRQSEATEVFFVVEGRVRVVNYSISGREITLDDVDAGGHFGELGIGMLTTFTSLFIGLGLIEERALQVRDDRL